MQFTVFGISGLRGKVGSELTPESVTAVAGAFGAFIGNGPVAVGRDTRPSGPMFTAAAAAGLMSAGCTAIDLGICPTPTVLHHVRAHRAAGGLIITASHNPEEWNGMKFVSADGVFLTPDELQRFKARLDESATKPIAWNETGESVPYANAVADHVAAVAGHELFSGIPESGRRLRVGIDAVNGAAGTAAVELVRALGCTPIELNCASDHARLCRGFPRRPEPTVDHLADLSALVRDQGLDFGVGFDPDGDRAGFVDETGTPLGEEMTICLACRYVLARRTGPVVTNLSTTRAVEDVCAEFKAPVERTPVGEAAVVERMKQVDAVVGGEGNGGVILPAVNFTRDGLVATAAVIGLVIGTRLSELTGTLSRYRMIKTRVDLDRDGFARSIDPLLEGFPGTKADRQDGLKLDGPDFWLHVRPSNTEPIVRIIAEARGRAPDVEVARAREILMRGPHDREQAGETGGS